MSYPRKIIDVHAHVLPGIDDGARSMREAVELLKLAASQGVVGVIATPHYSRREKMRGAEGLVDGLEYEIREYYPDFFVCLGQETYYHEELVSRLQCGEAMTMAGSRYVMTEFAENVSYSYMFQGIRRLMAVGYQPVLAHVERYLCLRQAGLEELLADGCCFQMNYDSLAGRWYQPDVRWCRRQVKEGKIQFLGTDMHQMKYRPPDILDALRWLENHISPEEVERMTYLNPRRMIADQPIRIRI